MLQAALARAAAEAAEAAEQERRVGEEQAAAAALLAELERRRDEVRGAQGEALRHQAELAMERSRLEGELSLFAIGSPESDPAATLAEAVRVRVEAEAARGALAARLDAAKAALQAREAELTEVQRRGDELATRVQALAGQLASLESELATLGVPVEPSPTLAHRLAEHELDLQAKLTALAGLETRLHAFLVRLETRSAYEAAEAIRGEVAAQTELVEQCQERLIQVQQRVERMQRLLAAVRTTRQGEEQGRLQSYAPLVNTLYQRLCAHPFFGRLQIKPDAEAHDLRYLVEASVGDGRAYPAAGYLSMSQRNAAALSAFLASAVLQGWTKLATICLDDPVQHMDDINIYAFLDLLENLARHDQQIIVTTSNEEMYRTMLGRFKRLNRQGAGGFRAMRMAGVTPTGPEVFVEVEHQGA